MSKTATVAKHETLADFPEVVAAEAKVAEMRAFLKDRKNELEEAKQQYPSGVAAEAEQLLTGETTGPDLDKLQHQVKVAETACNMAQAAYRQAFVQAGNALCNEHRPEHVELVERIRNAVAELVDALREEHEFCERFRQMGISPDFSRPRLEVHQNLLNEFRLVADDEFRS